MTVYDNKNPESTISNIEISGEGDKRFIFLHAKPRSEQDKTGSWIAKCNLDLQEVTRTHVDGHEVIVMRSDRATPEILQAFAAMGEQLSEHQNIKKLNPWMLRGLASNIGQPLQLMSGMFQKGNIDFATIGFAALNITANTINMVFGAEKKEDTNRLHYLKNDINRDLDEHLLNGAAPYEATDKRAEQRNNGHEEKKSVGESAWDFMKGNSVRIGEIGLRYLGSIMLAFPLTKLKIKQGSAALAKGAFSEAFNIMKNKDAGTFNAGAAYLIGKTIAFGSKIPDPYDPTPHTTLDTVREKILFPASSIIETVAAGLIAKDRLFNPKRKIIWPAWTNAPQKWQTKGTQDYLGGIGGLLFMSGLVIRIFAPFGKKELDMEEMSAHITDTLVKTPREEMPRLLADSAATVFEHTKEKGVPFGEIFTSMAVDLEEYHHIALHGTPATAHDAIAGAAAPAETIAEGAPAAEHAMHKQAHKDFASLAKTPGTHVDRHLQSAGEALHAAI